MVPTELGSKNATFADDVRLSKSRTGVLSPIYCDNKDFSNGGYACSARITLTRADGRSDDKHPHAYLNVNEFYNANTTFRVCLDTCSNPQDTNHVRFSGIQPIIDSTGRANTYFKRVQSRIEFANSSVLNVEAAVDIFGSLCKSFQITDNAADYKPGNCKDL